MQAPLRPFVSDGASGFISFFCWVFTGRKLSWEPLAYKHDEKYGLGGPLIWRRLDDATLERGVYEHYAAIYSHGFKRFFFTAIYPRAIYYGVRIGGQFWIPFPSLRPVESGGHFTLRGRQWRLEFSGVRWGYRRRWPRYKD